jgi:glutathione synthase
MAIKLGILMDPIESININKDTSFAMLMAAQARGYELFYMEMRDLYLQDGEAFAMTHALTVHADPKQWFTKAEPVATKLGDLDVILMRQDPPFDQEYIYSTYLLERAEMAGALVVNKPQSLRDANEKLFTAWFAEFTPKTLVSKSKALLKDFIAKEQDVIVKPLDGMGGASIFRVKANDPNQSVILETLTNHEQQFIMAQAFIPEIAQGDKRILIVNGQVVPYALARIPAQGETRGNLAAGGRGVVQPLSASDQAIATAIAPELKRRGLWFVGLDVIGDKVTEINVTSPTCLQEIEREGKLSVTDLLFDGIEAELTTR